LIGEAKCAGILIETSIVHPRQLACIIGFGVNVIEHPDIAERQVTSLSTHGIETNRDRLLADLDAAMSRRLADWRLGAGFEIIRSDWQRHTCEAGKEITVNASGARLTGRY